MKKIWDFIVHGYINIHTEHTTDATGKISIKLLVLLIGVIMIYNYLIQEDTMVDWIKNEIEEIKDWVISGTILEVKVWWVLAVWIIWKYVLG